MKTLFTLDYKNYDTQWEYSKRDSARGIIIFSDKKNPPFNEDDKIALVYAKNCGYFKFPGDGIHADENKIEALIREVSEEVGLSVIPDTVQEYGVVPRFQKSAVFANTVFDQESFYYFCKTEETSVSEYLQNHSRKRIRKLSSFAKNSKLNKITAFRHFVESFYYFCQVDDKGHGQNLDPYEKDAGFELRVVTIKEVLETNLKYKTDDSFNLAMICRDTNVLQLLIGQPLEPSRAVAEFILEESVALNPGPWREHSYAVARAAEKIATAVQAAGGKMNPDKAYIYGLLHDVGRRVGPTYMAHVIDGYNYLHNLGYENAARLCITHSFNLQTVDDYIGKRDVTDEQFAQIKSLLEEKPFDDYDRLIQLLDSTCAADGTQNLEERMGDVKKRYGYYPEGKWNKNFELKEYFEKLTGKDFYEIIK